MEVEAIYYLGNTRGRDSFSGEILKIHSQLALYIYISSCNGYR